MQEPRPKNPQLKNALIIDSDAGFLRTLQDGPSLSRQKIDFSRGGTEARAKLLDRSVRYMAIYLSSRLVNPSLIPLIRMARAAHPVTPISVLQSDHASAPFGPLENHRLSLSHTFKKKSFFDHLMRAPTVPSFPDRTRSDTQGSDSESSDTQRGTENTPYAEDARYEAVALEEFFSDSPIPFDIHVQVQPGKYLKLLNAGEVMETKRALEYFRRGVRHFYVNQVVRKRCLAYCDHFARACLIPHRSSEEVRLLQVMDNGNHALQLGHLDPAMKYLEQVYSQIHAARSDRPAWIRTFLENVPLLDHSVAVSVAAALLAQPLGITRTEPLLAIGAAALFHDLGLRDLPENLLHEDRSRMTSEEKIRFEQHPLQGAELLRAFTGMSELGILAVTQHHERRDDTGYPQRLSAGSIHLFSEIVGIADELIRLLNLDRPPNGQTIADELRNRVFQGFSLAVIEAFEKTFPMTQ